MIKIEIEGKIVKKGDNYVVVEVDNYRIACNYNHANQLQVGDTIHCKGVLNEINYYYNLEALSIEMNIEEVLNVKRL